MKNLMTNPELINAVALMVSAALLIGMIVMSAGPLKVTAIIWAVASWTLGGIQAFRSATKK